MDAKPDYPHWDHEDEFTVQTAAFLCCDLEPWRPTRDHPAPAAVLEMAKRFGREGVKIADTTRKEPRYNDIGQEPYQQRIPGTRYVSRSALREWAERSGRRPPFLFPEERGESPREWGFAHDTALLKIAREVIKEHWEGKDPARAPAKDWMVDYLIRTYGISKGAAEAIDQVTRHDSRSRTKTK